MIGLLEDIENSFEAVSKKIYSYQCWLKTSKSHFETDKYLEDLIALQRLLKRLSSKADKSIDDLIAQYY